MTNEEMNEWVLYHVATFPSWKRCFVGLPDDVKAAAKWRLIRSFHGITLEDAKAATDEIEAMENQPKLDRHVYEVAKHARLIAMRRSENNVGGKSLLQCAYCRDSGHVYAFAGSVVGYRVRSINHDGDITERDLREHYADNPWSAEVALKSIVALSCFCPLGRPRPSGVHQSVYDRVVLEFGPLHFRRGVGGEWGRRSFALLSDDERKRVMEGTNTHG